MRKITCCKDCSERHLKCHAECEKYIIQRKRLDEINKKEKEFAYRFIRKNNSKNNK